MDDIKFMTGFNVEAGGGIGKSAIGERSGGFYGGGNASHEELSNLMKDLVGTRTRNWNLRRMSRVGRGFAGKGPRKKRPSSSW